MTKEPEYFPEKEAARRRDEVIRRMANTPPQHAKTPNRPKSKTKAGMGRTARKDRARREA